MCVGVGLSQVSKGYVVLLAPELLFRGFFFEGEMEMLIEELRIKYILKIN